MRFVRSPRLNPSRYEIAPSRYVTTWPSTCCGSPSSSLGVLTFANGVRLSKRRPGSTFTKDVAPIFSEVLQNCHGPGSIAPMSLLTYDGTHAPLGAARSSQRCRARQMPPWHVRRTVGIRHSRTIVADRIRRCALSPGLAAGAPRGNPADCRRPDMFDDAHRWHIGSRIYRPMRKFHRQAPMPLMVGHLRSDSVRHRGPLISGRSSPSPARAASCTTHRRDAVSDDGISGGERLLGVRRPSAITATSFPTDPARL